MTQEIHADLGESKPAKRNPTRDGDLWYKRYPARFHRDTVNDHNMTFELRGAWSLLTDVFYENGGSLKNDDKWIAVQLACDVRKWRPIRRELEAIGKLFVGADGMLHNKTVDEVYADRKDKMAVTKPAKKPRLGTAAMSPGSPVGSSLGSQAGSSLGSSPHNSETPNDLNASTQKTAGDTRASIEDLRSKTEERELDPFSLVASAEPKKDDHKRVVFDNGKIELFNGLEAFWLEQFDGDAQRLELGLIQAAGFIQPNSAKPLEAQVGAQLARQCSEKRDRDKRYAKATDANAAARPRAGPVHDFQSERQRRNREFAAKHGIIAAE